MASNKTIDAANPPTKWAPETQLVHGGTLRSQFGETSEAMFLTQGFVYASAEQAEARFKNEDPGYQYSRFGNPTVAMFEERMRLLEGAEDARATATRHGGRHRRAAVVPQGRRSCRRGARHVRLLPLHRRDAVPALRHHVDADRRPRSRRLAGCRAAQHQAVLLRDAGQPDARARRHRRRLQDRQGDRRHRRGRQRVRDADAAAAAGSTAPTSSSTRRPSTSTARAAVSAARCSASNDFLTKHLQEFLRQTGPVHEPVQRLGDAEGPGDACRCASRRSRRRRPRSPITSPAIRTSPACSIAAAPTIRRPSSPSGR